MKSDTLSARNKKDPMKPFTPSPNQRKIPVWVGVMNDGSVLPQYATRKKWTSYNSDYIGRRFLLIDPKYYKVVKR